MNWPCKLSGRADWEPVRQQQERAGLRMCVRNGTMFDLQHRVRVESSEAIQWGVKGELPG